MTSPPSESKRSFGLHHSVFIIRHSRPTPHSSPSELTSRPCSAANRLVCTRTSRASSSIESTIRRPAPSKADGRRPPPPGSPFRTTPNQNDRARVPLPASPAVPSTPCPPTSHSQHKTKKRRKPTQIQRRRLKQALAPASHSDNSVRECQSRNDHLVPSLAVRMNGGSVSKGGLNSTEPVVSGRLAEIISTVGSSRVR